jgi:GT2 family glycosyltransferase
VNAKIGVVILNWNGWQMTLNTLESLRQSHEPAERWHVFVVDNGSDDDSVDHLRMQPDITLLELPENRGFATGSNVGIRHALAAGCAYVLLLNNDVILHPDFLPPLLDLFAQNSKVGIVSPKIRFADPPDRIWYAGGNFRQPRLIGEMVGLNEIDIGQFDNARIVDFVTGCCMLVKCEVFEYVGLLDEDFFFYQEDVDLSCRVAKAGYQVWYQPESLIWHIVSFSTANNLPKRTFYYAQSRIIFFGKHIHGFNRIVKVVILEVMRLVRTVLSAFLTRQPGQAYSYIAGTWSGLNQKWRSSRANAR